MSNDLAEKLQKQFDKELAALYKKYTDKADAKGVPFDIKKHQFYNLDYEKVQKKAKKKQGTK
jgi:hypothetical protein